MKKHYFLFFRLGVSAAILFALFKLVPYEQLVDIYRDSDKGYLVLGFFSIVVCYFIAAARWKFLLASLGIRASFREALYALFCGLFFNLFFPSFVAGDVFRGFSISYRHGLKNEVASSVLMDRFSGAVALILLACVSFGLGKNILQDKQILIALIAIGLIVSFAFLVIFSRTFFLGIMRIFKKNSGLKGKIIAFHDRLYLFKKNPAVFVKSLLFSFPIQALTVLSFFIVARAFEVKVGLIYFFILVPIISAIALIPITIAGAGTREASAVYFFSLVGIEKSVGLGISLTNLFFLVLAGILGGIFYVSVYHRWLQPDS